jgi:ABC-2 type transport system permease protein
MRGVNWIGLYILLKRDIVRIFRVATQTLVTPWISALLYIFIFGYVIGQSIDLIAGVTYIEFVLPGIVMMNVLASAFAHTSSSLYFKRFIHDIEEILVAPFSHLEMIIGFVLGGIFRGLVIGLGIFIIALFFGGASVSNLPLLIFYIISVSIIFALLGMIVALWADGFEQLNILTTFVITPLSFLGGVFYSIEMLPEKVQGIALANPFFYFVDGIRFAMIGIREGSAGVGYAVIFGLILLLGSITWYLFKVGWRLRE